MTTSTSARRLGPALLAGGALLLGACGGGDSNSSGGGGGGGAYGGGSGSKAASTQAAPSGATAAGATLDLEAVEGNGLAFDPKALRAKAGTLTLKLDNGSANSAPHAIAIDGQGLDRAGEVVQPGGTSTVTVKVTPGTYTFYCPVPGHRQAGREGKLTVN
jgi:plastocyanin